MTCRERLVNFIDTMARRLAPALALGLMVAMSPHSRAHADEIYTLHAQATVDVAPDGTVEALEFETDLGEAAAGYESMMRQWRFNPIMTTEGEPVERTVRVSMRVDLYATRRADGGFSMSTGRPSFIPVDDPDHVRRMHGVEHFPPPRYPEKSAASGYEAYVLMLVQVAADGTVLRVGTRSAALLNRPALGGAGRHIRPFVQEPKQAAGRMRFSPSEHELREVTIPIRFAVTRLAGRASCSSRGCATRGWKSGWPGATPSSWKSSMPAVSPSIRVSPWPRRSKIPGSEGLLADLAPMKKPRIAGLFRTAPNAGLSASSNRRIRRWSWWSSSCRAGIRWRTARPSGAAACAGSTPAAACRPRSATPRGGCRSG